MGTGGLTIDRGIKDEILTAEELDGGYLEAPIFIHNSHVIDFSPRILPVVIIASLV